MLSYERRMPERPKQSRREQVQTVLSNLNRLVPIIWRISPVLLAVVGGLHLVRAALPAAQVYVTKHLGDAAGEAILYGRGSLSDAYWLLVLQAALGLVQSGIGSLHQLARATMNQKAQFHLDELVARKAVSLPLVYMDRPEYYDQLQRASYGMRGMSLLESAMSMAQKWITVASFLVILYRFHWVLAAGILLLAIPPLFSHIHMGTWRLWQMRRQTPTARKASYISGLLRGREAAKEIRVFGLEEHLVSIWRSLFWQNAREQLALERKGTFLRTGTEAVAGLAGAGFVGFLLWLGAGGKLTLGDYVALVQVLMSSQNQMQMIAVDLGRIYEDALFTGDLFAFLSLPEEPPPAHPLPFPAPLRKGISVEGLTFSYPGKREPVLESISFSVRPGEKVAIVGENGAGKTTLVKCLIGLYRVQKGAIYYDGAEVRQIDPIALRRRVTAIFQDFVRYHLTARENIAFGRIENSGDDQALTEAAEKGGAHQVVAALKDGYEAQLGPTFAGGHDLSYGQWQKLALSRAFFRDADVIVLDEPTAALDPQAEAAVFERFSRLSAGKTALLISHRLGTCRTVDRILVLKGGRLVEDGTHEELMDRNGEYARMFRLQAQWYV